MDCEQFSLCWNNFHSNLSSGFHSLLEDEDLVDVTLAAEGQYVKAHKTILSVCSPYFKELFRTNPCKHPIVILQDVNYAALKNLLQFMYYGEVSVSQDEISTFMKVAETLKVKGLTDAGSNGFLHKLDNKEPKKIEKPQKATNKRTSKQIQAKRTDSPHTSIPSESPRLKSPESFSAKKKCTEDNNTAVLAHKTLIKPKEEPAERQDDMIINEDGSFDMSSMLNTSITESPGASGSWDGLEQGQATTDTSSPGTLQCILGKRGNPRLIVDGHTFFKKSAYKGKSFWYCKHSRSPYKCMAVCWTLHGNIVKWPCEHNHPVIPEPFNPDEDTEVPIEKLQEVLIQTSYANRGDLN